MFKKKSIYLIIIFLSVFIVKSLISLYLKTPFIFSDETCVIQKAIYFASNFEIKSCHEILKVSAGDPRPLYSILISPIYLFISGTKAYHAVLIFNSLIISSIVFPLYSIFKKFIQNKALIYLSIIAILFLPQIIIFEKTLMTETLFTTICIWFLYFYLKSFNKKSAHNKIIAIILSILAAFTRPFGFILPIALTINEIIRCKNKKLIALVYIPIAFILSFGTIKFFIPNLAQELNQKLYALEDPTIIYTIIIAIKNQLNSFNVTTFFTPIIAVIVLFTQNKKSEIQNIKYFIISFLVLNFIISAQHTELYLENLSIITRYINFSIILIFIFAFIFLGQKEKTKINLIGKISTIILYISLIFISYKSVKLSLNLDIAYYFDTSTSTIQTNLVSAKNFIILPLLIIYITGTILLYKNKKLILSFFLYFLIISHGILANLWIVQQTSYIPETTEFFQDKKENILFIKREEEQNIISLNFWRLLILSDNNISFKSIYGIQDPDAKNSLPEDVLNSFKEEFNYLVSTINFDNISKLKETSPAGTGSLKNEYIYDLSSSLY